MCPKYERLAEEMRKTDYSNERIEFPVTRFSSCDHGRTLFQLLADAVAELNFVPFRFVISCVSRILIFRRKKLMFV